MNPELTRILERAYRPCAGFDGPCSAMTWAPARGHIPRGFWGALDSLEEVRLVMVLAEPGFPKDGRRQTGLESALAATEQCYRYKDDTGHRNVRYIVRLCFPELSFIEAMRKVWITESVLCSIPKGSPTGKLLPEVEDHCVRTFLLPQLHLFPNAIVAAMGGKAYCRMTRCGFTDVVQYSAVYKPEGNKPRARASWKKLADRMQLSDSGPVGI